MRTTFLYILSGQAEPQLPVPGGQAAGPQAAPLRVPGSREGRRVPGEHPQGHPLRGTYGGNSNENQMKIKYLFSHQ